MNRQCFPRLKLMILETWTGTTWQEITTRGNGLCHHSHSMTWDGDQPVIAGGYLDTYDTSNQQVWLFRLDSATPGRWSLANSSLTCTGPIRPGAWKPAIASLSRPVRSSMWETC